VIVCRRLLASIGISRAAAPVVEQHSPSHAFDWIKMFRAAPVADAYRGILDHERLTVHLRPVLGHNRLQDCALAAFLTLVAKIH
jgi:hypothetical protein